MRDWPEEMTAAPRTLLAWHPELGKSGLCPFRLWGLEDDTALG